MPWLGKVRPQILVAIMVLGTISTLSILNGDIEYIAVATGCTGGIIALGMKLLEGE